MRHQIRKDIKKLETRGLAASSPLVGHFEGKIWYLRCKCKNQWVRIFYYRSDEFVFRAFYAIRKDQNRLPGRHKKAAREGYEALTGEKHRRK